MQRLTTCGWEQVPFTPQGATSDIEISPVTRPVTEYPDLGPNLRYWDAGPQSRRTQGDPREGNH